MEKSKIVAIIREVSPEDVVDIVNVLLKEGINDVEVSLSNEKLGLASLKKLAATFSPIELSLGSGTVLTKKQVDAVKEAGGQYIITPGWNKELVKYVLANNLSAWPGVFSPGEIAEGVELGLTQFKLFPISGLNEAYIQALRGPFPSIELMGVGGVNQENLEKYADIGIARYGIGSELVPRGATKVHLEQIQKAAKAYQKIIRQMEGKNVV